MRGKARFEYVDEFRKINCLQKLPYMENLQPDEEHDVKQDNNKFIRFKEEILPTTNRRPELLRNPIIDDYKVDLQSDCVNIFAQKSAQIEQGVAEFQDWSNSLHQEIKQKQYGYQFYFQGAQPPPRLKEDVGGGRGGGRGGEGGAVERGSENTEEDATIQLPQRLKYNFHDITRYLYSEFEKEKENMFMRDVSVKREIVEMREIGGLQEVEELGGIKEEWGKFSYHIETRGEICPIEFVDNSIVRGNNALPIDYFRDIGTPSRHLREFTLQHSQIGNQEMEDQQTDYKQEQIEMRYLYHLREEELKINKNDINFFDLANIAMGRITPNNAHMCVRSEKVTKAQYNKLLKKMEKYDMRENEKKSKGISFGVGTEELEEDGKSSKAENDPAANATQFNLEQVISDVNNIRREVKLLEEGSEHRIHPSTLNKEIYTKLEKLLNILLDSVTQGGSRQYSLDEIGDHLEQIEGTNQYGYDKMRLLWFIANCYDQMLRREEQTRDLRHMQKAPKTTLTTYKDHKPIKQQNNQPKKVFGFNKPASKTPAKVRNNRTPIKAAQLGTAQKAGRYSRALLTTRRG